MKIKNLLIDFVTSFLVVLVVASTVTYLWNLIFHTAGSDEGRCCGSYALAFPF